LKSLIEILAENWVGFNVHGINWTNVDLIREWSQLQGVATWDWEYKLSALIGRPREIKKSETGWLISQVRWIASNKLEEYRGDKRLDTPKVRHPKGTECHYCDDPDLPDTMYIAEPYHQRCVAKLWREEKKDHLEMLTAKEAF
jgi:hypothetical protein